jgi:hypothetical protein
VNLVVVVVVVMENLDPEILCGMVYSLFLWNLLI